VSAFSNPCFSDLSLFSNQNAENALQNILTNIFFFKYLGCVTEYFKDGDDLDEGDKERHKKLQGYKSVLSSNDDLDDGDKECHKKLQAYKSVLSSKAREDSLVSDWINASNFKGWLNWWKPEILSAH
jgi:hypothetical protein